MGAAADWGGTSDGTPTALDMATLTLAIQTACTRWRFRQRGSVRFMIVDHVPQARRVLVISTSMGAGHNGNATELLRQLRASGDDGLMVDQLDLLPLRIGHAVRGWYRLQLRFVPWTYERSWRSMNRMHHLLAWLNGVLCWRRLHRLMAVVEPDVVVANNPLGAQTLGHLRSTGRLKVPTVTFITDFGVHELWVHSGVDAHLCVHPQSAVDVGRLGGRHAVPTGPLVAPSFLHPLSREAARLRLKLFAADEADAAARAKPVVVVTSGSWGVGEIEKTVTLLAESCHCRVVVPCGRDLRLRQRLQGRPNVAALGWTDDMATVLAAADVVVENAGGLSAMEAFAVCRPVITFRPLPGHGRHNAEIMSTAGVVTYARSNHELVQAVGTITSTSLTFTDVAQGCEVGRPNDIFRGGAIEVIAMLADAARLIPWTVTAKPPRRRRGIVTVSALAVLYSFATGGVQMAVAAGVPLAAQLKPAPNEAFVAVRLNATEMRESSVRAAIGRTRIGVIVDDATAAVSADGLRDLAVRGVPIASGEDPSVTSFVRARLHPDKTGLQGQNGRRMLNQMSVAFVFVDDVDALDVARARRSRMPIVLARQYRSAGRTHGLRAGHLYVEDERTFTIDAMLVNLHRLEREISREGVRISIFDHTDHRRRIASAATLNG